MIFTFDHYSDLGRCSYATLKESFDSEKDEIYLNNEKVEIKEIQDLFPFLWQNPGMSFTTNGVTKAYFFSTDPHWHQDYDKSIIKCEAEIKKLQGKLTKDPNNKRANSWMDQIKVESERRQSLIRLQERLDEEKAGQEMQLIIENEE